MKQISPDLEKFDQAENLMSVEVRNTRNSSIEQFIDFEIDVKKILSVVWQSKLKILISSLVTALIFTYYALILPDTYTATTVLMASSEEKSGGLSSLANQYGGIASLAGIQIGGSDLDKSIIAMETLKSRYFLEKFIDKYEIKPQLMAATEWDVVESKLIFDSELFDASSNRWADEAKEPSEWETYKRFSENLFISQDKETGLIRISFNSVSPILAAKWVELIVFEINLHFQQKEVAEAQRNIDYLQDQINQTLITEMQNVFYRLIEDQAKTVMLANANNEYVLKIVSPVMIPAEKSGPRRSLFVIVGLIIGLLMSGGWVLFKSKEWRR